MIPPRSFLLNRLLLGLLLVASAGCDNAKLERALMDRRVGELERQIKVLEDKTEQELSETVGSSRNLVARLDTVEEKTTEAMKQASDANQGQSDRFQRIEQGLAELVRMQRDQESMAYLSPDFKGHYTIRTEHGVLLIRLDSLDRDFQLGGFVAHLSIGNPMGITVQEFILKGDFGTTAPKLAAGEAYEDFSKRLDEWQRTLTPFEQTYLQDLPPSSWTRLDLRLNAESREKLSLIRTGMKIRRAHLINVAGESKISPINLRANSASILQTDYGALLANVKSVEKLGEMTKVSLLVGNPYGFVINKIRLKGEYGPTPPQQNADERPEAFSTRISQWNDALKPFESSIDSTVAPMQWSEASFLIREPASTSVAFVRCRVSIDSVTLRAPQ
ncbi:MAG: hypothetical protein IT576_01120 [Verrucomicrobiales bacterium]|nr:hypothetical protein [Verrucomicrobiales bacterium]